LLNRQESFLLGYLVLYALPGFIAAIQRKWTMVKHIGKGHPKWTIYFTVFGLPFLTRPAAFSGTGRHYDAACSTHTKQAARSRADGFSFALVGATAQTSSTSLNVHRQGSGTPRPFHRFSRRRDEIERR
jgi:hypothetical protein